MSHRIDSSDELRTSRRGLPAWAGTCLVAVLLTGCGSTQQSAATQQLLQSDAVDAAIAQVDFSPLAGRKVFFDTTYLIDYKGVGFVNANYVISGIRQQILSAGCELQDAKDKAEVIVEGRLGTLGSDEHDLVYGIPKNNAINSVASAVPGSPSLPAIPELAVAKKVSSEGAAKLALFAYDRSSRKPVWQSGLAVARSSAQDTWLLGAGPFQNGTIHKNRVRLAGRRLSWRFWSPPDGLDRGERFAAYEGGAIFHSQTTPAEPTHVAEAQPSEPARLPATTAATPLPGPAADIVQTSAEVSAPESKPAPDHKPVLVTASPVAGSAAPEAPSTKRPAAPPVEPVPKPPRDNSDVPEPSGASAERSESLEPPPFPTGLN
jgi:hypothetical protein